MEEEQFSSDNDDYFLKPKKNIVKDKGKLNKKKRIIRK